MMAYGNKMDKIFEEFLREKCGANDVSDSPSLYMHRRRLMVMVDRRGNSKWDALWMFEPPANCREMPSDAVNEWGINALCDCLLPQSKGNNINIVNGCPRVLTISTEYREEDSVQCHWFWNGQMHRFLPQEMEATKAALRDIFLMESQRIPSNNGFFEGATFEHLMGELQQKITDTDFSFFRKKSRSTN